jgi:hypothetical protein
MWKSGRNRKGEAGTSAVRHGNNLQASVPFAHDALVVGQRAQPALVTSGRNRASLDRSLSRCKLAVLRLYGHEHTSETSASKRAV